MNLRPLKNYARFSEELNIKYLVGSPRNYCFNGSNGTFGLVGKEPLTKVGQAFSFVPVAYRLFKDDILRKGLKTWVEFFFVNEASQMSSILFHGFSVQNLKQITQGLYYDDVSLTEILLIAQPVARTNKDGQKYFVCQFSYKLIEQEDKEIIQAIGESFNIYREGTHTGDCEISISMNYGKDKVLSSADQETSVQATQEAQQEAF